MAFASKQPRSWDRNKIDLKGGEEVVVPGGLDIRHHGKVQQDDGISIQHHVNGSRG